MLDKPDERYSAARMTMIVDESLSPGVVIADIARKHGVPVDRLIT